MRLTKDISAAQEKLLHAEQVSGQRMDELEAAHAQLQVTVALSLSVVTSQYTELLPPSALWQRENEYAVPRGRKEGG